MKENVYYIKCLQHFMYLLELEESWLEEDDVSTLVNRINELKAKVPVSKFYYDAGTASMIVFVSSNSDETNCVDGILQFEAYIGVPEV